MAIKQLQYETLLAEYSSPKSAIALLRKHRPYLEMLPSLRRPDESVITIPLPLARLRHPKSGQSQSYFPPPPKTVQLPCDLTILTCDPEWKIKMGVEIMIFIHRPQEEFSEFLRRWRETETFLSQEYEWVMPPGKNIFSVRGRRKPIPCLSALRKPQS